MLSRSRQLLSTSIAAIALLTAPTFAADVVNNGTLTLSGGGIDSDNISGTGNVIVTDPAGITLTGTNTYTGGTRIDAFRNVTLQIGNGGTTGSIVGDIANPLFGFVVFNHSNTYTYAGNITGGGDGRQTGGGTLVLTGNNTFGLHEFFTIDAGSTMQLGNGGTTGTLVAGGLGQGVVDNGVFAFNRSDSYTFSSNISGAGVVRQIGTGTITLTGSLSYTGGTGVSSGTFIIPGRLPSGAVSLTGGTLQVGALNTAPVTVAAGATLGLTGSTTAVFQGGTVINSGTVNFLPNGTANFTGSVTGTGLVTVSGSGTQIWTDATISSNGINVAGGTLGIAGNTSFTGLVTVGSGGLLLLYGNSPVAAAAISLQAGGLVQIGNSGTSGVLTGDVADAGTLRFQHFDAYTFANVISGAGGVQQAGFSPLTLSGNNTYTGVTDILKSVLVLTGSNASSSLSVAAGATLQVGNGGTSGSISGNVVDNGTVTFNRADTVTYGGAMSGTGGLVQSGGTLILAGANSYTGPTTIAAGATLQVGSGGTGGTITGNVTDSGVLAFNRSDTVTYGGSVGGTGTIQNRGTGTLILSGISSVNGLSQTAAGTLDIEGIVNVGGSTVAVTAGQTLEGHGYLANGLVSNTGGTVAPGASIGTLHLASYTQTSGGTLQIEMSPTANDLLQVDNTAQLGGALNLSLAPGSYGSGRYVFLTAANVTGTFSSVAATPGFVIGLQYTSTDVAVVMTSTKPTQMFSDYAFHTLDMQEQFSQQIFDHAMDRACVVGGEGRTSCPEISVWFQGLAGAGSVDGSAAAAAFNTRMAGGLMGVDAYFDEGFWLGASVGFAHDALTVASNQGRVNSGVFSLGATAGAQVLGGRIDGSVLYMRNVGDSGRVASSSGGTQTAIAHPKNDVISLSAQYARPVLLDDLSGIARLTYVSVTQDAWAESGASPYDFGVRAHNYSTVYSDLLLRASHPYTLRRGAIVLPQVYAGLRATLSQANLNFTGDPIELQGAGFSVPSLTRSDLAFVTGAGISINRRGLSLYLRGDGRFAGNQRDGVVSVGAAFHF